MIRLVLVVVLGSCYQGYGQEQCDSHCLKDITRDNVYSDVFFYDSQPQPFDSTTHCSGADWNRTLYRSMDVKENDTFWYSAKRVIPYGPYEDIIWGWSYGRSQVTKDLNISSLSTNCLVKLYESNRLIPANCSSYHRVKCVAPSSEMAQYLIPYCSACPTCRQNASICLSESDVIPTGDFAPFSPPYDVSGERRLLCPQCFNTSTCTSSVKMVLTFNERRRSLYLAIYSPECIYNHADASYVSCFTDASDDLKKPVDKNIYMYQKRNVSIVYSLYLQEFIGNYWCEARSVDVNDVTGYVSNNVTAYRRKPGNEIAAKMKIDDICSQVNCDSSVEETVREFLDLIVLKDVAKARLMKVFEFDVDSDAVILVHFSMYSPNSIERDYQMLRGVLWPLDNCELLYMKSSDHCVGEVARNLTWPTSLPHQSVLPEELCLQENGLPIYRMCGGDFLHGYDWMEVSGDCSVTELSEQTTLLQNITSQEITKDIVDNVTGIVRSGNVSVTDLFYVSQILERFSANATSDATLFDSSLDLIDGLLSTNSTLLADAQDLFNLTDAYLRAVEYVVTNRTESVKDTITIKKKRILTHSFNPLTHNVSGFLMFRNQTFRDIRNFTDVEEWTDVDLALCLSEEDIRDVIAAGNASIVAVVYLNSAFFHSGNVSVAPNIVVNLNIPNYDNYLRNDVPMLVRVASLTRTISTCAFWDYGDASQPKKGAWSDLGGLYGGQFVNDSELQLCSYSHLTHLALLIGDRISDAVAIDSTTNAALSVITATGSILSCFGIAGIFITALAFKSWRSKAGTQILLHLSVAILLEIVFMYVNDTWHLNCTATGFVLHYVVLCKFCWMLVYAFCQYMRFVRVLGPLPDQLVLKSAVVGWGVGLMPSMAVLLADPQSYNSDIRFCYPTGLSLYLGVYLPVLFILSVNLAVFCKILVDINKGQFEKGRTNTARSQHIKLAVLLCSVLGIPWIIGFLFNVLPVGTVKTVFIYIFTISSVLQGFVMFLFYVVFNPETKSFWDKIVLNKAKATSKGGTSMSLVS
ncbi:adhesion G-protein coupled receptor G6-like [Rhynchophorus ferrugineus]|uniref:adhesion G-protein coupled receptor G6-like n=1 Tax=Rhynchophorus ferrugineus TaxID=354439 RepID=UPI003FCC7529